MDPKATVREFIACINAHDAAGLIALCTLDHLFVDSLGATLTGLDRLEQGWQAYFALFPDYKIGELVLACGSASGTHAHSGEAWRIPAAWRARVVDGRIAEWQVYADNKPVYEILSRSA
jgi:ketosteroid isomerase-like protein